MIGPLRVHFADRYCDLSALVMGDEALFGAVPMEMMDLILHPASQTLSNVHEIPTRGTSNFNNLPPRPSGEGWGEGIRYSSYFMHVT
jgi:hypothetical protein